MRLRVLADVVGLIILRSHPSDVAGGSGGGAMDALRSAAFSSAPLDPIRQRRRRALSEKSHPHTLTGCYGQRLGASAKESRWALGMGDAVFSARWDKHNVFSAQMSNVACTFLKCSPKLLNSGLNYLIRMSKL